MVSDQDRRDLYEALERGLGERPAATMMELLPPVGWADLARQSDLVAVRGEIAGVRGEIAEVSGAIAEVRGEIAEVRGEIAEARGEIGKVHGELARLSARIDGQIPRFLWANVPVVASVAGLVLAAGKLT
jgi:septal ring factor EnvC (AmiA/AmiB activator)